RELALQGADDQEAHGFNSVAFRHSGAPRRGEPGIQMNEAISRFASGFRVSRFALARNDA
ncbi:MAG: hypothetical protein WD073_09130, partial [Xanthobacteraceae bacterium]